MHSGRSPSVAARTQVGAIRLEQIRRADVGLEPLGDQRDDIHQSLGRLAAFGCQRGDFFQRQNVICIKQRGFGLAQGLNPFAVIIIFTIHTGITEQSASTIVLREGVIKKQLPCRCWRRKCQADSFDLKSRVHEITPRRA